MSTRKILQKDTWLRLQKLPPKCAFISDMHIGVLETSDDEAYQKLCIELISDLIDEGYQIFLLGDIFDYWLEYDGATPPVGQAFRDFLAEKSAVHVMYMVTGNHDNWTEDYFSRIGISELSEGIIIDQKYLLCHGDGFKDDKLHLKRPFKHRILRNRWFITLFKWVFTKEQAWEKMKSYSLSSRLKEKNSAKERNRLTNWASNVITNNGFSLVVCGHDHLARLSEFENGYLLNCGFFLKDRTFGLLEDGYIKLMTLQANGTKKLLKERCLP